MCLSIVWFTAFIVRSCTHCACQQLDLRLSLLPVIQFPWRNTTTWTKRINTTFTTSTIASITTITASAFGSALLLLLWLVLLILLLLLQLFIKLQLSLLLLQKYCYKCCKCLYTYYYYNHHSRYNWCDSLVSTIRLPRLLSLLLVLCDWYNYCVK